MSNNEIEEKVLSGLMGFATADAMGVPIEFTSRASHSKKPLTEMVGYGSHHVPAGTWSDDTSMTIAAMDSIAEKQGVDFDDIMNKYCQWAREYKYTATDKLFDIGNGTRKALSSYYFHKTTAVESGGKDERNNGNGSLMRMLPIVFYAYYQNLSEEEAISLIHSYSSLTHGHPISKMGCHIYFDFMKSLLYGKSKEEAFNVLKNNNYSDIYDSATVDKYKRILDGSLKEASINQISSSGYVVSTLEASIWTLLHSDNYEEAVVTSINMGEDTDTVGAITGSMAGILYGRDMIPKRWTDVLLRKEYLEDIAIRFSKVIDKNRNKIGYRFDDEDSFNHDRELYKMLTGGYVNKKKENRNR